MKRFILYFTSNFIIVSIAIFFILPITKFETFTYWHATISSAIIIFIQYFLMKSTEHKLYRRLILYFSMCLFIIIIYLFEIPLKDFISGVFIFLLIGNIIGIIPFIVIVLFNRKFEKYFFEIKDVAFTDERKKLHKTFKITIFSIVLILLSTIFITTIYHSYITKWSEIKTNLPKNIHINQIEFVDSLKGYLSGNINPIEGINRLSKNEAWIYSSQNGGITWKGKSLGLGNIDQITNHNNSIYILKTIFTEDSFNNAYSTIYYSNYGIDSLKPIYTSDTNKYIRKIFFSASNEGIIDIDDNLYIFKAYKDSFQLKQIKIDGFESTDLKLVKNDTLVFSKTNFKDQTITLITKINSNYYETETSIYPIQFIIDNKNNIWKIIQTENKQIFYKRLKQNTYLMMATYNSTEYGNINDPYIYDNQISGILNTNQSIIGVSHEYIYFDNNKNKWRQEEIPFPLYGDFTNFGKNYRWGKTLNSNELQIRK